jgi:peroxiredoxin
LPYINPALLGKIPEKPHFWFVSMCIVNIFAYKLDRLYMKIRLLTLGMLLAGTFSVAQNKPVQVTIEGTVPGVTSGYVYLQKFQEKLFFLVDSAKVENGKFQLRSAVQQPELYGLTVDQKKAPLFLFVQNASAIHVVLDTASYYKNSKITGSEAQVVFDKYRQNSNVKIDEFIRENPASIVSAYVLYRNYAYRLTPDQIRQNIAQLDPSLHGTQYVGTLEKLIVTMDKVAIGKPAIDFTAYDTEGKPLKLSDHFGKYLLIDFWAAWCGPCRKENPNLVKAYHKYKDKGFDVFGVSLDRTKEAWLKAIAKDELTWTQVSDLKYWHSEPAALYGVRAIPANFLLSPDGKIVGKNLTGEELHKKLEELLGEGAAKTAKSSK